MITKVNTFEILDKALTEKGVIPVKKGQRWYEDAKCNAVLYEYHLESGGGDETPLVTIEYCIAYDGGIFRIITAEMFDVRLDEDGSIIGRADEGVSLLDVINESCHLPRSMAKTFNVVFQNTEVENTLAEIIEKNLKR